MSMKEKSSFNTFKKIVILEHNPNDSRVKIKEDGIVQTLCSRMGTGGATYRWC